MENFVAALYVLGLVAPPAAVLLGALLLSMPRHARQPSGVQEQLHAH